MPTLTDDMQKAGILVYKRARRDKSPAQDTVGLIYAALTYASRCLTAAAGPCAGPPTPQQQGSSTTLPAPGLPMPALTDQMRIAGFVAYEPRAHGELTKCRPPDAVRLIYDAIS